MVTSRKHVSRLEAKENYVVDGKITITEEKRNEIKKLRMEIRKDNLVNRNVNLVHTVRC